MGSTDGYTKNFTGNGDSDEVEVYGACHFHVSGDFGGGTCKLQIKDTLDGTFRDIANASHTVAADQLVEFPQRALSVVKANLAGSTSPDLYVMIRGEIF